MSKPLNARVVTRHVVRNRSRLFAEALEGRQLLHAVAGVVYDDPNGNGLLDAGETPMPGQIVNVYTGSGSTYKANLFATVTTDQNGAYAVANIPTTGSFTVEVVPDAKHVASRLGQNYTTSGSYVYNETLNLFLTNKSFVGGFVFEDSNGNGIHESGDGTWPSSVRVYIDLDHDGSYDAGEPTSITNDLSQFQIGGLDPGDYTVRVVLPTDYVQTGPALNAGVPITVAAGAPQRTFLTTYFLLQNIRQGSISGRMFYDFDGDGIEDFDEGNNWSHGIQLIPQNIVGETPQTAYVDDYNGGYSFTGLRAGTYVLRPYDSYGSLMWTRTTPAGTDDIVITLPRDAAVTAPTIGLTTPGLYPRYTGVAFNDANGNGVQDAGESGIAGRTIYLDSNNDGADDNGENYAVTDSLGRWSFATVAAGTARFRQVLPSTYPSVGYVQTTPAYGAAITVDGVAGQRYENLAFGSRPGGVGSIGGIVYDDVNTNGVRDGNEAITSGTTVFLDANNNGGLDAGEAYVVTTANGFFFPSIAFGTYHVRVVLGTGRATSTPLPDVTLTAALPNASGLSIGAHDSNQFSTITGFAFDDKNGDGVRQGSELGAAYATVFVDSNHNGTLDPGEPSTTPNAATGAYSLSPANPGAITSYTIHATAPAGYAASTFAGVVVFANAGQTFASIHDFGFARAVPTASAGLGYAVNEGGTIALSGAYSSATSGRTLAKYEWDFDYDGNTFQVDATGVTTAYVAGDGAATRTIALRVTDDAGQSNVATSTVTIANVAPSATLTATGGVGTATATFTKVTDPSAADVAAGFKYSFDFNNDGDFTDPGEVDRGTSPTATGIYAAAGTYTILAKVYDKDGDYTKYVANVTVTAPPTTVYPPSPSFTGSSVHEGNTLALSGFSSSTSGIPIVKWEYDFDYDGTTFTTDATTQNPTFDATNIDGPATRQVAIRITDAAGLVGLRVQSVTITNVAPSAAFAIVANANGSATVTFSGTSDPSAADLAAGLKYSFDFNGDGDFDDVGDVSNATSPTATFAYAASGTYTINARITDKDGGYTAYAKAVTLNVPTTTAPALLTGTVIGTAGSNGNSGNTIAKAFDGSLTTYFDAAAANGAWAGLDLGSAKTVTSVKFAPRAGLSGRMVGGLFQGSATANFSSGVVTLATIAAKPVEGAYTTLAVSNGTVFRYVRYLSPTGSFGNVAELAFYGTAGTMPPVTPPTTAGTLTGTVIGTSGSNGNGGNTIAKAFDGSLTTFVDLPASNGGWAGLDLGALTNVAGVRYAPRAGLSARMVGGVFQGSTSATFTTGVVTLATIAAKPADGVLTSVTFAAPAAYRYVRYLAPAGSFGNVAEVQFFAPSGTTMPPVTPPVTPPTTTPTKLAGTTIGTAGSNGTSGNTVAKATDGDLATFFDGSASNGNWVGLDLGAAKVITQIAYAPRIGLASRMLGGIFQGSNSADFSNAATLLSIVATPETGLLTTVPISNATAYRYVRYLSPAGSFGNVAEIAFYA